MAENKTQQETSFRNDCDSPSQDNDFQNGDNTSNKPDEIVDSDDKKNQKKICSFYRRGNCKHGL